MSRPGGVRVIAALSAACVLRSVPAMNARAALALIAALVVGCDKKKSTPTEDKPVEKAVEKKETASKPLTAAFFGKTVGLVGALTKLKWGQTEAEARAAAPELFPKPDAGLQLVDAEIADVRYGISLNKETKKIDRLYVQVPASAAAMIATAWGAGKDGKDKIGRPRTYWFNAASGWRAYLEPGFGEDKQLVFFPYVPAEKLLGDGPETIGFAPQGILGATVEELRTRFPDTIVETDAAKAAEQQKEVSKFAGKDLEKELGKAKPSVRLDLPPTEWEEFWTRIHTHWGADNKVEEIWFGIPYETYAPAKEELRAMFEKKWGKPKEAKEFGTAGDTILIYRAKAPRVIVKDNTISHQWDVRFSTKTK